MARFIPRILEGTSATSSAHWLKPVSEPDELSPRTLYRTLRAYYLNNSLYHEVQSALESLGYWQESMEPLRNPTYRVIEFYVAKLWPGRLPEALPIETDNPQLTPAVEAVWQWSNWSAQKQVAARWLALYGDWFVKVAAPRLDQVFLQNIDPQYVTDFDTDHRGFITYIRVDTPQTERNADGSVDARMHTEVWNKAANSWRVWVHEKGYDAPLDRLGDPDEAAMMTDRFGIDFVPFVHAKKMDLGDDRGIGAVTPSLHKIDEANRQVTRLHQMLFRHNRPEMAIESDNVLPDGRPLPPPRVEGEAGDMVDVGDEQMWKMPSGWKIKHLVAQLNYADALAILNAMMIELEADLPELAYYRLLQQARELSGRALRQILSPAVDRVAEARGNAEAALVRAQQMALTMGQNAGLEGFTNLGDFEAGDFEHHFTERDIIPLMGLEAAQEDESLGRAALIWQQIGVSAETTLERLGFDPIEEAQRREARAETLGEGLLQAAEGLGALDRGT